ncbi:MAG: Ig-like domain-containing protein [Clostridiales bacterium]|nr:Ig-like domain-containing protein [Clostridiales bacterium]
MDIHIKRKPHIVFNRRAARILTAVIVFAVLMIVLSVISVKKTDTNSEFTPKVTHAKYPSLFYHYTGFDHSNTEASIKPGWVSAEVRLKDGKAQLELHTIIYPITLEDKRVVYKSSDENIAVIDENGKITAKKPGTVTFTATLAYNGESAVSELKVIQPVTGIFMPQSTITINMSDAMGHIRPTVYPENASDKSLIWESSNPKVVRVDLNGNIRPVSVGMAEVSAKTADGGFVGKCFVNVVNKTVSAQTVAIQNKEGIRLDAGQSMSIVATVSPSNAKDKTLVWSSSNTAVATISKTGKIKALTPGKTTISAATSNGKKDSFELEVGEGDGTNILDLYAKRTSNEAIPADILGSTYVKSNVSYTNGEVRYESYDITLPAMVKLQMSQNPPPKINGGNSYASEIEVMQSLNPENYHTGAYKFQFLDLSHSNGLDAGTLNEFLKDKGILAGKGQAFIDAANAYNVSEVYLIAHACLETGNGTSTLSRGVSVNGVTVYNMYGIGAYDSGAVYYGSQRAYEQGWTTPEAAIKGGAKWISDNYINNASYRQNTLYKMRWNPASPTQHQYATDIEWATQQADNIERIFASFPNAVLTYEVPVYSGQTAVTIE